MQINQLKKTSIRHKLYFGCNIAILSMVILGMISVFAKTHPTAIFNKVDGSLFKYYSFIVNTLAAIISALVIIFIVLKKNKLISGEPKFFHILNLTSAVSLAFNMLFTVLYLLPVNPSESHFTGANLLFNIFIPVVSIFSYVFCCKENKIKLWQSFIATIPTILYFVIYFIVAMSNIRYGKIQSTYDWYMFGKANIWLEFLALISIILIIPLFSFSIWYLNKISKLNRNWIMLVFNASLIIISIVTTVFLFYNNIIDFKNNPSSDPGVSSVGQVVFKRFLYFTHWSLWLICAGSCITVYYSIKLIRGRINKIPLWAVLFKLAAVTLGFITLFMQTIASIFIIIGASSYQEGIYNAWNKNWSHHLLLEHFLIPFIATFSFITIEHYESNFRYNFITAAPLGIYCLIYMIVLYANIHNTWTNHVMWDVYGVMKFVKYQVIWMIPIFLYWFSLLCSWLLWLTNRKIHFELPKAPLVLNKKS